MTPITLGLISGLVLLVLLVLYAILVVSRRGPQVEQHAAAEPAREPGEREASLPVEQIEEIARRRIEADPELAGIDLDFGATPDGELAVWVDGERYNDIAQIPSADIRAVIQAAIDEFNQAS